MSPGLPVAGAGLEARVQRVFLAQGIFAERSLYPSADRQHRMLATDVDVLISEYSAGFHLTRRHFECKGGKVPVLDRVLWLRGLRELLKADASYLVLKDVEPDAARFARSLNVELMSIGQIYDWEQSLGIPDGCWPARSDYEATETLHTRWRKRSAGATLSEFESLVRDVFSFLEIDSWLSFRYANLNRLIRHLDELGTAFQSASAEGQRCCRYLCSALVVRLSQYIIEVCRELSSVAPSDLKVYLLERLTYGDQNAEQVKLLLGRTVGWVKQALEARGGRMPADVEIQRLFSRPAYADDFVELVLMFLKSPSDARHVPIALEVAGFDDPSQLVAVPRLVAAVRAGEQLGALVRGFAARTMAHPRGLFESPHRIAEPVGTKLRAIEETPKPLNQLGFPKASLNPKDGEVPDPGGAV